MLRLRKNFQLDRTDRRAGTELFGAEHFSVQRFDGVEIRLVDDGEELFHGRIRRDELVRTDRVEQVEGQQMSRRDVVLINRQMMKSRMKTSRNDGDGDEEFQQKTNEGVHLEMKGEDVTLPFVSSLVEQRNG